MSAASYPADTLHPQLSIVLDGEYGISGTAVGVPVVLGRAGAREAALGQDLAALRESAEVVRAAAASIGSPLTSQS